MREIKHKKLAYVLIIIVAILIFLFHLFFLDGNEKFDFIPYTIGSFTVFAICFVKNAGKKAEEWNGSYTGVTHNLSNKDSQNKRKWPINKKR